MAFTLNTDTLPVPALPKKGRSSLQELRRMMFIRWSAGKFLTTIGRNHGVKRPALGFSDDDFFRGALQVLANDTKAVRGAFVYLLENTLGPYEDLFFELDSNHAIGDGFIQYRPYADYVPYTNWNATPFTVGERLEATHPVTGERTIALLKEHDAANTRIFFTDEYLTPGAGRFDIGHSIVGQSSGGKVDVTNHVITRDFESLPLYGQMIIDPGGGNEEEVTFVCPDPFVGRVRLVTDLTKVHVEGEKIKIDGGCWDFIETKARRIVIRVRCEPEVLASLRGNAYFHPSPALEPMLRETVGAGDADLKFDESIMENLVGFSFPQDVLINPEDKYTHPNSRQLKSEAASYVQATRTLTLSSPLNAGAKYLKGTPVRLFHAKTGELLDNAAVADPQVIVARCRWEHPYGVWALDLGGGSEEKVFVTGTSYQKRLVTTDIFPLATSIWINHPLKLPLDLSHAARLVISDPTGVLGFVTIDPFGDLDGNEIPLVGIAGFSTTISANETVAEYCRGVDFGVNLTLHNPLAAPKTATLDMVQILGTTTTQPTYDDHLVNSGWPANIATPDGSWPGPNLWEPSLLYPSNTQGTGKVEVEIDRTDADDVRIYLARETLTEKFNPATPSALPVKMYNAVPYSPKEVHVVDGDVFPTQAAIDAWILALNEPPKVTVSGEGTFLRPPLYLWGRVGDVLHVSGITLTHLPGIPVATLTTELPVKASVASLFGGDPGLSLSDGTVILDHGSSHAEDVDYDGITVPFPLRGLLTFDRGFSPQFSHEPFKLDPLSNSLPADVLGVSIMRADKTAVPRVDGFSFPFYLNGGIPLYRLRFLLDMVRAAGIEVTFVDQEDIIIPF